MSVGRWASLLRIVWRQSLVFKSSRWNLRVFRLFSLSKVFPSDILDNRIKMPQEWTEKKLIAKLILLICTK